MWEGGPQSLGPALADHARQAEEAGVSRISVMDHFWQIGENGPPQDDMLEAYTLLGYLAGQTSTVLLHTLVTGVIYREPALVAKAVSTLDVLSGGRAGLGIGAGWNEDESTGLGFPFPSTRERLDRLEEAVQICLQMWSDSDGPFDGRHYRLGRTLNAPQPVGGRRPYLMIGGGGEKRTLKLVARYADACNLGAGPDAAHKLSVLKTHCDAVGRDYDSVEKTTVTVITPTTTLDDLLETGAAMSDLGFSVMYLSARGMTRNAIIDVVGDAVARLR